jgi:hypothetical protein
MMTADLSTSAVEGSACSRNEDPPPTYFRRWLAIGVVVLALIGTLAYLFLLGPYSCAQGCSPSGRVIHLNPTLTGSGVCGVGGQTYNSTLHPTSVISTQGLGVELKTPPPGAHGDYPGPAQPNFGGMQCAPAAGAWYGVLWASSGTPEAVISHGPTTDTWFALPGSSLPVNVQSGDRFEVISNGTLDQYSLHFFGINGVSADGSALL